MLKLLLATNNPGKVIEILELLRDLECECLTPTALGLALAVPEDGETYAENAAQKASAYARASGMISLGDDSGLEVDALDGKPGIQSHRFSPRPQADDRDRRLYLLHLLREKPRPWRARFCAAVAVATPGGEIRFAAGHCPGEIIPEERGTNGFGYDPIFLLPQLGLTMAELGLEEKNCLSHRAQAVQNLLPVLKVILKG